MIIHELYCPACKRVHKTTDVCVVNRGKAMDIIHEKVWLSGYFYFGPPDQGAALLWPMDATARYHKNECVNKEHPMIIISREAAQS